MQDDYDWLFSAMELETTRTVDPRIAKRRLKQATKKALKKEKAHDILTTIPEVGESFHIISNGTFDYFNFLPVVILLVGGHITHFYGSTWTMNRTNVEDMFKMFDDKQIGSLAILTGTYFKRRETAVYATLLEGLLVRNQRYISFENHAKVMLMNTDTAFIVMESSANFTANPRLENTVISNDKTLWEFHRDWMEEMLNG